MIDIAKIERGSPNAGMDEPFQSEQTANAAYIVTACNAVPKLVEMVMWMAEKLEEEAMPQECEYNGKTMVASLSLEDWLNQVYEVTEPKEGTSPPKNSPAFVRPPSATCLETPRLSTKWGLRLWFSGCAGNWS